MEFQLFSISSLTNDISSLLTFTDELAKLLEDEPEINTVAVSGSEEQEIQILCLLILF